MPRYAAAVVATVLAGALLRTLVYAPDVKADWRGAAAHIHEVDARSTVVLLTDAPTNYGQFVPLRYYLGPNVKIMMMAQALEQLAADPSALGETAWTIVEFRDGKPKAEPPREWLERYAPTSLAWTLPAAEIIYYHRRPPPPGDGPTQAGTMINQVTRNDRRYSKERLLDASAGRATTGVTRGTGYFRRAGVDDPAVSPLAYIDPRLLRNRRRAYGIGACGVCRGKARQRVSRAV